MRFLASLPLAAAFTALALPIGAQVPTEPPAGDKRDPIAAELLYRSGRELLKNGDRPGACAKFAASMALNPRVVTLINLAECSVAEGKLLQALLQYKQAAAAAAHEELTPERRTGLEELIRKSTAEVELKLPKLRVVVEQSPPGLEVRRDDEPMLAGMFGEGLPVDPGPHLIQATAPGYKVFKELVQLQEGQTRDVAVKLVPRTDRSVTTPYDNPPGGRNNSATSPSNRDSSTSPEPGRHVPVWAWITGGVGVALIGAAIPFKLDSAAAERALDANCGPNRDACPADYDPASDNARKNRSFGVFLGLTLAGSAGVGAGIIGIITALAAPSSGTATKAVELTPSLSPNMAGANLLARF